jgi:hypothetical protein
MLPQRTDPPPAVRPRTLWSVAIVVPLGFYTKYYRGPGAHWVNDSLGGLFYEIFWCLAVLFWRPGWRPGRIAAAVLAATCALEFLQLWHPPAVEVVRGTFPGTTVLGTTFAWSDFPYYFAGSGLGWLWMNALRRRSLK